MGVSLAVFASGNGSNFEAIAKKFNISLLVCDKPGAKVIERASNYGVPSLVLSPKDYPSKDSYEEAILTRLKADNIGLIALAGYMRIIGATILNEYENRIINIHPSLLPAFPGKDAVKQAYDYGVKISGVTVHYVDAGIDTGQIIDQRAVEVGESLEAFEKEIHKVEHQLYVDVLMSLNLKLK